MIIQPESGLDPQRECPDGSVDQDRASAAAMIRECARRMLLISAAYLRGDLDD